MNTKALFFLRTYNDIDHIVPVIYKLATTRNIQIIVILRSIIDVKDDYRINFLKKYNNIKIYSNKDPNILIKKEHVDSQKKLALKKFKFLLEVIRILILRFLSRLNISFKRKYQKLFITKLMDNIFGEANRGIIAFDWTARSTEKVNFAQMVINNGKKRGIHHICLPHGDCPYYNRMFKKNTINYESIDQWGDNPFDIVVVPNNLCAKRYTLHKEDKNIKILGSPRYNEEWLKVLQTISPIYENKKTNEMLKLVFFLRNPNYPVFWEEVIRAIEMINQFPQVYLIVKHHTRSGKNDKFFKNYLTLSKKIPDNFLCVYEDIHSGSLIKWADAVLDIGTSVIFEAVRFGKPILSLDYLHPNISTSAYYLKNTAIQCRDDLYDELRILIKDKTHRLYSEKERVQFIKEMIDVPDSHVLERYVKTIEQVMKEGINNKIK